jgi:hypothetical protein
MRSLRDGTRGLRSFFQERFELSYIRRHRLRVQTHDVAIRNHDGAVGYIRWFQTLAQRREHDTQVPAAQFGIVFRP